MGPLSTLSPPSPPPSWRTQLLSVHSQILILWYNISTVSPRNLQSFQTYRRWLKAMLFNSLPLKSTLNSLKSTLNSLKDLISLITKLIRSLFESPQMIITPQLEFKTLILRDPPIDLHH